MSISGRVFGTVEDEDGATYLSPSLPFRIDKMIDQNKAAKLRVEIEQIFDVGTGPIEWNKGVGPDTRMGRP